MMPGDGAGAPVLVFGDDSNAFLGAVRSLGRKGLVVHSASAGRQTPALASRYLAARHAVPHYRGDGAEWLASIRALVREHGFSLLVPTSDASLAQIAAHRQELLPARCAVPPPGALALFTDKWATREAALMLGIPVADGLLVDADDDPAAILARLGAPLILKRRCSYLLGETVQKSAVALVSSADEIAAWLAGRSGMMAERFLPGFCRGLSVLAHEGRVVQAFQHRRVHQEHMTGPSSSRVSEPLDPRLLDAVRKLVAHAGHSGIAMFEFRCEDAGDAFALLEVNPRSWGSMQLAMDAGADFVAAWHGLVVEGTMPPERFAFALGRRKMAMEGEWDRHADAWKGAAGIASRLAQAPGIAAFFGALAKGTPFDSFAPDDPEPFRRERARVLARLRDRFARPAPRTMSGAPV